MVVLPCTFIRTYQIYARSIIYNSDYALGLIINPKVVHQYWLVLLVSSLLSTFV